MADERKVVDPWTRCLAAQGLEEAGSAKRSRWTCSDLNDAYKVEFDNSHAS